MLTEIILRYYEVSQWLDEIYTRWFRMLCIAGRRDTDAGVTCYFINNFIHPVIEPFQVATIESTLITWFSWINVVVSLCRKSLRLSAILA